MNKTNIKNKQIYVNLLDKSYFETIKSGVEKFNGEKDYLSTKSINWDKIQKIESKIRFDSRPSRANMQPTNNSVWFAKMKNTIKVYYFDDKNIEEINKFILSTGFLGIKCKDSVVPTFLKYFFFSTRFNLLKDRLAKGSTQQAINNSTLKQIYVLIPTLKIQKKIVSVLERVDSLRQKREQTNQLTDKLIQAVFYKMFGDPVLNNRKFPMESLDNIVANGRYALKRGPFGGSLKKNIFVKEGYKVYEQQNAIKNDFELGHYYITSKKFEEMKAFSVNPGDIIISCSGTIGKVAIVPSNAKKGIINQALLKITFDRNKISPIFAKFLIETPQIQELLFGSARGSGIRNIASMAILKSVQIPIPPLSLQNKFAEIAKKIEILKEKQKLSEVKINNLFQSLTNIAFEVEL